MGEGRYLRLGWVGSRQLTTLPHLERAIVRPTPAASAAQAPVTATVAHLVAVPSGRHCQMTLPWPANQLRE